MGLVIVSLKNRLEAGFFVAGRTKISLFVKNVMLYGGIYKHLEQGDGIYRPLLWILLELYINFNDLCNNVQKSIIYTLLIITGV